MAQTLFGVTDPKNFDALSGHLFLRSETRQKIRARLSDSELSNNRKVKIRGLLAKILEMQNAILEKVLETHPHFLENLSREISNAGLARVLAREKFLREEEAEQLEQMEDFFDTL